MRNYILLLSTFLLRTFEVFAQVILVLVLSDSKIKLKKFFIVSIILSISFEIIKLVVPQYLTAVTASVLAISVIIIAFKIDYKKVIISYLITIITTAIVDCALALAILKISNFQTLSEIYESKQLMILGRISLIIILSFIAIIVKNLYQRRGGSTVSNIKKSMNLVTLIVTFFLLLPNLIMIIYYYDKKTLPLTIIIINIVAIVATFIISILHTTRGIKLIQIEEELTSEKLYNSTLQHLVDSLRSFKHDYSNTLHTIDGYIFIKDWDGLRNFIDDVVKEAKTITTLDRLNPELFKNPSLFGLVTAKFEYARKSDVNMNFEIYADLENMDIRTYDFTRILGILLDNAIEASAGSEKKVVNFYVVERNAKVTIEISNSFSDTGLKIEDMHKKGASSKGENRGLGLYKVKEIIDRYPNIKLETTMANGMFLQKLVIDKVPVSK